MASQEDQKIESVFQSIVDGFALILYYVSNTGFSCKLMMNQHYKSQFGSEVLSV